MNLNPVEWSKAQDLLTQLVQVLTPLTTERIVPASFFLSRRFFMPPALMQEEAQPMPLRHPVKLLTTLQKQVETWIGEVPEKEVEGKHNRPAPKIERRSDSPPLSKQAQKLIVQVQEAIVKLSTSSNIQTPQEAPLREALLKLKPQLDRIIDSMAKETPKEETLPHPVQAPSNYKSSREELLLKLLKPTKGWGPAPQVSKPLDPKKLPPSSSEKTVSLEPISREKVESEVQRGEGRGSPLEKRQTRNEPEAERPTPQPVQKEGRGPSKPIDVTHVPLAPFIAQAKNIIHPEKKKKKRKGFWSRSDEDPEDRP